MAARKKKRAAVKRRSSSSSISDDIDIIVDIHGAFLLPPPNLSLKSIADARHAAACLLVPLNSPATFHNAVPYSAAVLGGIGWLFRLESSTTYISFHTVLLCFNCWLSGPSFDLRLVLPIYSTATAFFLSPDDDNDFLHEHITAPTRQH